MAKPFLKWAGGKGKILRTLEQKLPPEFLFQGAVTYIEPFCGGDEYYCSDECLKSAYSEEEIASLCIGDDDSESYWTVWWENRVE